MVKIVELSARREGSMIDVTKRAAEAFKEIVAKPENMEKRIRVTLDAGG